MDNKRNITADALIAVVDNNRTEFGTISWLDVQKDMLDLGYDGSTEKWRSQYRRIVRGGKRLLSETSIEEIEARRAKGENIEVWFEDGLLYYEVKPNPALGGKELNDYIDGDILKIAILGDTHIGSKSCDMEGLYTFYKYAYDQGVRNFYHTGDMTDGMYKNRDNSFYEQNAHGFQEQIEMVINYYPKIDGVTTYFITGNHDVTHMRNGGADVGRTLDIARRDMIYLGHNFGKVWLTPELDINLIHPTDGGAQAVSHKLQKIIDAAEGKRRAKIMAIGHYHKMAWVYWKGVHGFVTPSFQKQTEFMRDNNLKSYTGGYILTIKVNKDGELISITPEYFEVG